MNWRGELQPRFWEEFHRNHLSPPPICLIPKNLPSVQSLRISCNPFVGLRVPNSVSITHPGFWRNKKHLCPWRCSQILETICTPGVSCPKRNLSKLNGRMLELQSSTYNKDTMPCTHLCHPGVTTLLTHVCNIWASCIILILLNLIVMLILEIRESKHVWCHLLLDDWRLWKGLVKRTLGYWK